MKTRKRRKSLFFSPQFFVILLVISAVTVSLLFIFLSFVLIFGGIIIAIVWILYSWALFLEGPLGSKIHKETLFIIGLIALSILMNLIFMTRYREYTLVGQIILACIWMIYSWTIFLREPFSPKIKREVFLIIGVILAVIIIAVILFVRYEEVVSALKSVLGY